MQLVNVSMSKVTICRSIMWSISFHLPLFLCAVYLYIKGMFFVKFELSLEPVWPVFEQVVSPYWIIKSNRSQNQCDQFNSAPWLVLSQVFVLSQNKRALTRMFWWSVISTTTHTSLLKAHLLVNNTNLKAIIHECIIYFSPSQFPPHIPTWLASH